jgi:hypothetical protein
MLEIAARISHATRYARDALVGRYGVNAERSVTIHGLGDGPALREETALAIPVSMRHAGPKIDSGVSATQLEIAHGQGE